MMMQYPESYREIDRWAELHRVPLTLARRRFIQFCVLECAVADAWLQKILVLRGSAALQLFYGGRRDCVDIDFVALKLDDHPVIGDGARTPRAILNRLLAERLPMHFNGEQAWEEWLRSIKIDISLTTSTYDVRRVTLSDSSASPGFRKWIQVATLEVLIAQKICALTRAFTTKAAKTRAHDVFDIASLVARGSTFDVDRVRQLVARQAQIEQLDVSLASFGSDARTFVGHGYPALAASLGKDFIPFDDAWSVIAELAAQL